MEHPAQGPQSSGTHAVPSGASSSSTPQPPAHWQILAAVIGATFLAYARTLSYEFVYDDFLIIVTNPAMYSWRYLSQYFTGDIWAAMYPGIPGNYYRPVFLLWCRVNEAMFGNQAGMWHLTTLLTHVITTVLVYFLAWRLFRDRLAAGAAGLIFGLHPAHIEAVAWISGVTEPLLAVFFIGAFLCYLKQREGGPRAGAWRLLALCLYALAMLEKETALLLPAIIAGHEWLFGKVAGERGKWRVLLLRGRMAIRAAMPFFILTIPYLAARILALKGFSHIYSPIPWSGVVYTWPSLLWFWIHHLLVPVGLGSFYDFPTVEHPGWINFVLPAAAVAAVGLLLGWGVRRSREIAFACAWIFLPLIPLLDLRVFPHNDFAHDRFLYLPSVGLAILIGVALRRIPGSRVFLWGFPARQLIPLLALALVLGYGTRSESFYFENNWVFNRYNYLLSPANPRVANNYGAILARLGMREEAIKVLKRAHENDPGDWSLAYNLGLNYYLTNQLSLAEKALMSAIQIDPTNPNGYFCLGLTEHKAGNPRQAARAFRTALQINPQGQEYHYQLGIALKESGDLEGALAELKADSPGNPTYPESSRLVRQIQEQLKGQPTKGQPDHPTTR